MEEMQFIVADLNGLIAKYGIKQIKHALNYIDTYPSRTKMYEFKDSFGIKYVLDQAQFDHVNGAWANGLGKIQAIKMFREITSCGLKEAKDAIEAYYQPFIRT